MPKAQTGIAGLDEITEGGLPRGRPTLVCGSAGSGKTLLAVEFIVRGAIQFDEPGVLMTFEESAEDLAADVASLGFDLARLVAEKKIVIDHVQLDKDQIEETGEYDLEGLFIRLDFAISSIGAKRLAVDTIESLFAGLSNTSILRAELARLFRWLKDRGMTAVITAERGEGTLTRHGIEEYVSDAVIVLDHRIDDHVSTRRLRIAKYRGSRHGTNEYPFLIGERGLSILPVTSLGLRHEGSRERVSSGVAGLDDMLGGKGFYKGSTILVSGGAGAGKSSLAGHFVEAACRRGERAVFFLFEESPAQFIRNMESIGVRLQPWATEGRLLFHAARPALLGLEQHLVAMHQAIEDRQPTVVVFDSINDLLSVGPLSAVRAMLVRLVDFLKTMRITAFMTSLTSADAAEQTTDTGISSLVDTWILLRTVEEGTSRRPRIYVLKARGMAHSREVTPFDITSRGVQVGDISPSRVARRVR